MNRAEFLRQLEALLYGISQSEREEAMQYYNDYFDDAGFENENDVIHALGSPAKVAETIKAELNGKGPERSEYTERGYQNGTEGKQNEVGMAGDYQQNAYGSRQNTYGGQQYGNGQQAKNAQHREKYPENNTGKILLIIVLAVLLSPVWLPVIASVGGVLLGIIASIFGIVLAFGIVGVAFFIVALVLLGIGVSQLFLNFILGMALLGAALILAGLAIFFMVFTGWLCKTVLPAIFKGVVYLCRLPFNRGGQPA